MNFNCRKRKVEDLTDIGDDFKEYFWTHSFFANANNKNAPTFWVHRIEVHSDATRSACRHPQPHSFGRPNHEMDLQGPSERGKGNKTKQRPKQVCPMDETLVGRSRGVRFWMDVGFTRPVPPRRNIPIRSTTNAWRMVHYGPHCPRMVEQLVVVLCILVEGK